MSDAPQPAPPLRSALYRGTVRHRRLEPAAHAFTYRLFMLWLDLDELDRVFAGRALWSVGRPNVASFRREDYLGDPETPLADAVRATVHEQLGTAPAGAVRMLTLPRLWGFVFNPVTFYYCHDAEDRVAAIVTHITNTPWGERHAYVVDARDGLAAEHRFPKTFHVSPFMPMDHEYAWRLTPPGATLGVHMENRAPDGRLVFDATLALRRAPLDGPHLARCLAAHPFMTGKVIAAIYWQALKLFLKRTPFHAHPATVSPPGDDR